MGEAILKQQNTSESGLKGEEKVTGKLVTNVSANDIVTLDKPLTMQLRTVLNTNNVTGSMYAATFSSDGNYLVTGHITSAPYITLHKKRSTSFTYDQLPDEASIAETVGTRQNAADFPICPYLTYCSKQSIAT